MRISLIVWMLKDMPKVSAMSDTETKRRRKLNSEQIEVLRLLYKFRFGTNDLFAQYFGKKDRSFVYKRLKILHEQGLVGKRFDSSYRLLGRPAAYYLNPEGARTLQEALGLEVNIKAIYKDKSVSEQFVSRSLGLFAIHNRLKSEYGDSLKFFTRSDLNREDYDYFLQPLPDAYVRLDDKQFFLDIFYDTEPSFVAKRRIRQYIKYDEDGDWVATETELPKVIAVCESKGLAKRVQKYMAKALDDAWPDSEVSFVFTTKPELMATSQRVWQRTDDSGDMLSLQDI